MGIPFWDTHEDWVRKILPKMIQKRDVKGLVGILREEDTNVYRNVPPSGSRVKYEDIWSFRRSAVSTLKEIAETAINEIRAANVEKKLTRELKNKDRTVRKVVVDVLDKLEWKPTNDKERIHYLIAKEDWDGLIEIGQPAVKPLISCLEDYDTDVCLNAARALGTVGDAKAIAKTVKGLLFRAHTYNDAWDASVQIVLATLADIGKQAVPQLIKEVKGGEHKIPAAWALCQIGDRQATEAVVDFIFWYGELLGVGGVSAVPSGALFREKIPTAVLSKLVGKYASLMLDIFAWQPTTDPERFDVSRCNEAVQRLCMIKTPISSNILHKVTRIDKLIISMWGDTISGLVTQYIDFKLYRRMAEEELKRRGKPRYDSSAYLDPDAWRL